jgi:hypothetical protein
LLVGEVLRSDSEEPASRKRTENEYERGNTQNPTKWLVGPSKTMTGRHEKKKQ